MFTNIATRARGTVVVDGAPDVVCFSVMSIMQTWAKNLARVLKEELPGVTIVFGGYHPTGAPDTVIKESAIDYVIVGEGENSLLGLLDALENGELDIVMSGMAITPFVCGVSGAWRVMTSAVSITSSKGV